MQVIVAQWYGVGGRSMLFSRIGSNSWGFQLVNWDAVQWLVVWIAMVGQEKPRNLLVESIVRLDVELCLAQAESIPNSNWERIQPMQKLEYGIGHGRSWGHEPCLKAMHNSLCCLYGIWVSFSCFSRVFMADYLCSAVGGWGQERTGDDVSSDW
jgi:hypothetical protein